MAGEASLIMVEGKEEQVMSYMDGGRQRELVQGNSSIKALDLVRLTIMRTAWERLIPMIQLPPTGSLPQHVGIQDKIWVGTQQNHQKQTRIPPTRLHLLTRTLISTTPYPNPDTPFY